MTRRYIKAVSDLHRMQSAQIAALRQGDGFQFEDEIKVARKAVDEARSVIAWHERQHGC